MSDLWAAIAIAMILEGLMPFLVPKSWKEMVAKIALLSDSKIRVFGLVAMLSGLTLLTLVR